MRRKGFTLVEIMIVVVIIGLLAAMAIPAFQKVRQTSREKTVLNNLRQLAGAAQQYMLDQGVTVVGYTDIVGSGKQVSTVKSVVGENYAGLFTSFGTDDTQFSIDVDGGTVIYNF